MTPKPPAPSVDELAEHYAVHNPNPNMEHISWHDQMEIFKAGYSTAQSEITALKEELEEAREVIGFYANKENWSIVNAYDRDVEGIIDLDDHERVVRSNGNWKDSKECGGKRAREYLNRHKGSGK